jgi:hypothetical protein
VLNVINLLRCRAARSDALPVNFGEPFTPEVRRIPVLRTRVNKDRRTGLAMVRAMKVEVEPKARSELLCRALELQGGERSPVPGMLEVLYGAWG